MILNLSCFLRTATWCSSITLSKLALERSRAFRRILSTHGRRRVDCTHMLCTTRNFYAFYFLSRPSSASQCWRDVQQYWEHFYLPHQRKPKSTLHPSYYHQNLHFSVIFDHSIMCRLFSLFVLVVAVCSYAQTELVHQSYDVQQCSNTTTMCASVQDCCAMQYSPTKFGCKLPGSDSCCMPGPPLVPSTTLKNCLIIGDSG